MEMRQRQKPNAAPLVERRAKAIRAQRAPKCSVRYLRKGAVIQMRSDDWEACPSQVAADVGSTVVEIRETSPLQTLGGGRITEWARRPNPIHGPRLCHKEAGCC